MQTAHNATGKPLVMGEGLHGLKGTIDTGIKKDKQVDTGDRYYPEKVKGERT